LSDNIYPKFQEATERDERIAKHGSRLVPLAAAIIAVLAALGTLFSHHRSILALTAKNEAILAQARASDKYNQYEAQRVRYHLYTALLVAGVPQRQVGIDALKQIAEKEQTASLTTHADADDLEKKSRDAEDLAARILKSYETLEIGTTFCEVAIVLVSISALVNGRILLALGCGLSAFGVAFLIVGYFQAAH